VTSSTSGVLALVGLRDGLKNLMTKISTQEITEDNIQKVLREIRLLLLTNDVALSVADDILVQLQESVKGQRWSRLVNMRKLLEPELRRILAETLKCEDQIDLLKILRERRDDEPLVVVFIGVNGTGKTTTVAKLGHLLKKNGYRVVFAASDTYRSGAQEQLKIHADRLGIRVVEGKYGSDASAVAFDAIQHAKARKAHAVLIDTAGRMQTSVDLMGEMEKIIRVTEPDINLLVVDALAGNDAAEQAREFSKHLRVDGAILNKMDADAKGGAAVSIVRITGRGIAYIGTGQNYADIAPFNPEKFVDSLFN